MFWQTHPAIRGYQLGRQQAQSNHFAHFIPHFRQIRLVDDAHASAVSHFGRACPSAHSELLTTINGCF